ncbi:TlpA disulfide reductase family protein [Armatimonas sp.]|uniref:TlpA family protein disulfide reductase n=1 Tax=Armatimonas sp. TaxID=1872638 RepID=UPI00286AA079|nr:TlpA disulfide reductase family protein [Armatimonas sp.]
MKATIAASLALMGILGLGAMSQGAGGKVAVKPVDAAGLKKEVAARKGKVVIINFWATWCPPCRAEFPEMVATQKKYAAKGVDLLTVTLDDRDDTAKAGEFLSQQGATTGAFINKKGGEPDLGYFKWLDGKVPDSLGIPRTYVIDRKGRISSRLIGGQSAAAFEDAIKKALAAK